MLRSASSYAPFTVRVWLNGHEWAKRQLAKAGVAFESLDNGFLSVADPERAQRICDRLDALAVESFFERWLRRLRLKGLIQRIPGRHRYVLTPAGRRVALFFTKAYVRVLRGGLSRLDAPPAQTASDPLVLAWNRLDRILDQVV